MDLPRVQKAGHWAAAGWEPPANIITTIDNIKRYIIYVMKE